MEKDLYKYAPVAILQFKSECDEELTQCQDELSQMAICGDVDNDGVITIFDALKIAEYDAGLIPNLCE